MIAPVPEPKSTPPSVKDEAPVPPCATLIASYNIPKVVYGQEYERDMKALEIFDFYDIECVKLS